MNAEYATIVYACLLAICQYALGFSLVHVVSNAFASNTAHAPLSGDAYSTDGYPGFGITWLLGLLAHLSLALLLKSLGSSWLLASILPLLIGIVGLKACWQHLGRMALFSVAPWRRIFTVPFVLWLLLHGFLGQTLFSLDGGVFTPWVNNYGDLTFHLGMISAFSGGENFPPAYHLFPGDQLSYPYFVNLWTALLWWPSNDLAVLPAIFAWQWIVLWGLIFKLLDGDRYWALPLMLLLGGGSYLAMIEQPEQFSWRLINEGYPWTTWLSTIWVTQRSALLGAACGLTVCYLVLRPVFTMVDEGADSHENRLRVRSSMFLAGMVLGLAPLAHTHFFVVTSLFVGLFLSYIFWREFLAFWRVSRDDGPAAVLKLPLAQALLCLVLPSLLALVFFPTLMGKSGMVQLMVGWNVPVAPSTSLQTIGQSGLMWLANAGQWLVVFAGLWWLACRDGRNASVFWRHALLRGFWVLVLLFVLGNIIKLAVWDWDQLKVFVAIFTMMLALWSAYLSGLERRPSTLRAYWVFAIILSVPGAYEAWRVYQEKGNYQVYNPEQVKFAQAIIEKTPDSAVIAAAPDHNSTITLTGRKLYLGYIGTLASHKIDYQARERRNKNLTLLRRCKSQAQHDPALCPQYLYWDYASAKYWNKPAPGAGFRLIEGKPSGMYRLYYIDAL